MAPALSSSTPVPVSAASVWLGDDAEEPRGLVGEDDALDHVPEAPAGARGARARGARAGEQPDGRARAATRSRRRSSPAGPRPCADRASSRLFRDLPHVDVRAAGGEPLRPRRLAGRSGRSRISTALGARRSWLARSIPDSERWVSSVSANPTASCTSTGPRGKGASRSASADCSTRSSRTWCFPDRTGAIATSPDTSSRSAAATAARRAPSRTPSSTTSRTPETRGSSSMAWWMLSTQAFTRWGSRSSPAESPVPS